MTGCWSQPRDEKAEAYHTKWLPPTDTNTSNPTVRLSSFTYYASLNQILEAFKKCMRPSIKC